MKFSQFRLELYFVSQFKCFHKFVHTQISIYVRIDCFHSILLHKPNDEKHNRDKVKSFENSLLQIAIAQLGKDDKREWESFIARRTTPISNTAASSGIV